MGAGALGEIQRMQRLGVEREIRVGWGCGGAGGGGGSQENGYKPCLDHIIIFLNHAVYVFLRFL